MPRVVPRAVLRATVLLSACCCAVASDDDGHNWPSFRGPRAAGVAEGHETPVSWSVERDEGVLWKTAIPGMGHGSPVIWGDRLYVTTAVGPGGDPSLKVGLYGEIAPVDEDTVHRWKIYCLNKRTGEILWERTAHEGVPAVRRHTKSSHANSTPATDGEHVVAFFGSEGLHCFDTQGKLLWKKDFGLLDSGYFRVPDAQWGFGSSPVIHDGRVIVQCDVQKNSFLAALRVTDGEVLWRVARDEVPTWSSPTVVETESRTQVVVNGWRHIGGYDFETGESLWRMRGGGDIPVPTPVFGRGLIFITNAHGGPAPVYGIRPGATGDITLKEGASSNEHVAWSTSRGGAYMQTPLVYGDHLYVCRDNGVLTVFDAKSGRKLDQQRLGGGSTGFTASGVAADGKLYYTSEIGEVHVLRAGASPEPLAKNDLGEICMATPAVSEGVLYFRTKRHVIAVGRETDPKDPS